jgi:hypothetical protein
MVYDRRINGSHGAMDPQPGRDPGEDILGVMGARTDPVCHGPAPDAQNCPGDLPITQRPMTQFPYAPGNLAQGNLAPGNLVQNNLAQVNLAQDNLAQVNLAQDSISLDSLVDCLGHRAIYQATHPSGDRPWNSLVDWLGDRDPQPLHNLGDRSLNHRVDWLSDRAHRPSSIAPKAQEDLPPSGHTPRDHLLSRAQQKIRRWLPWGGASALALLLLLGGCGSENAPPAASPPQTEATPGEITGAGGADVPGAGAVSSGASSEPNTPPLGRPHTVAAQVGHIPVQIYTVDHRCQTLVPSTVQVPQDQPLEGAIAAIIQSQDSGDFQIAGYRILTSQAGQRVTLDLRLAPGSRRSFHSLSSCEQFALFGSLRQTLLSNSQWGIKEVEFTDQGKAIVL